MTTKKILHFNGNQELMLSMIKYSIYIIANINVCGLRIKRTRAQIIFYFHLYIFFLYFIFKFQCIMYSDTKSKRLRNVQADRIKRKRKNIF